MKVTRTEILPGVTFYYVRRDGMQPGRPWPAANAFTSSNPIDECFLIERGLLLVFGLTIAWSVYREAAPAASGAPVGILRSRWIYTRKRAYGRGTVVDLAKLQSIEIKVADQAPIVTESGYYELRPPIALPPGQEDIEVRIHNRNPVQALGYLTFIGTRRAYDPRTADFQNRLDVSGRLQFAVAPGAQRTVQPIVTPLDTITSVQYASEPGFQKRRARIFGRPEWLD